ncbi:tRNA 2-selenouridine(34) synthase MnmH [Aestuariibacter salexigens]|uniref:tRNA 2-selenouridine(34) synthase MnmH n=1 Tax=Aestuariibacter salexigens TaxID=226010 RepID=UPI000427C449|nr:tRNA 2-selenouridine(34) synthase MnmH [Aestuariibacter salexigens]
MTERADMQFFQSLLLDAVPLIDTRSPGEFARGAFPCAVNLPLMSDIERAKVGTCYKQHGQEQAIALGHELVSGIVKAQRVHAWQSFISTHPDAYLYCWRGGLRSQIVQQWLKEEGVDIPRLPGGYKALRNFILQQVEVLSSSQPFVVIAGYTGSGKTELLARCRPSIDLEGLARHRGSAFGTRVATQPSQINFENSLVIDLLCKAQYQPRAIMVEDEGGFIGSCNVPLSLHNAFQHSDVVLVDVPFEQRVDTIVKLYIEDLLNECNAEDPEQGIKKFASLLSNSLARIRKRLGNEAYQQVEKTLKYAIGKTQETGQFDAHREWIAELLTRYYDPMYDYQLERSGRTVIFKGDKDAVCDWWHDYINR